MVINNRDFSCLLTNELVFRLTCDVWRHYWVLNTIFCMILFDITCCTTALNRIPFTDTRWRNHVMQGTTSPEQNSRPSEQNFPARYEIRMRLTLFRRVLSLSDTKWGQRTSWCPGSFLQVLVLLSHLHLGHITVTRFSDCTYIRIYLSPLPCLLSVRPTPSLFLRILSKYSKEFPVAALSKA